MALDLTGIQNENEFYTSYYLREVLGTDLKDAFADWAEQSRPTSGDNRRPPHEALGGQSGDYFQTSNQLLDATGAARRLQLQRELLTPLLETLGYDVETTDAECCGMAGSFGYKCEYYELSMDVGEHLESELRDANGRQVLASGTSCTDQIDSLLEREPTHPIELIAPE